MARGISLAALTVALAAATSAAAPAPPSRDLLAGYSFDEDDLATGPDTFAVFHAGRGDVRLSPHFRVSGHQSVEIRDAPGDGDFPELQGYFPLRGGGRVYAHFSFLTTDVSQTLNVALAGPAHFRLAKDGIAFWLAVRDGRLIHTSDSIPKRLAAVKPFVWYSVDLDYDVAAGRYDLLVKEEGTGTIVDLEAQPNSANQPASAVDKFSFVGDVEEDDSSVTYYVDDVVIASSEPGPRDGFVAPGRRKLFLDSFQEYRRLEAERLQCLPITGPADLGLDARTMRELATADVLPALNDALAGKLDARRREGLPAQLVPPLAALSEWGGACLALQERKLEEALAGFDRAAALAPGARLYGLSAAIALAGLRRFEEAERRLLDVWGDFGDDARTAVVFGVIGLGRGDAARARAFLERPAPPDGADLVAQAAVNVYYYALLADRDHDAARTFAARRAALAGTDAGLKALWLERQADAAFWAGDRAAARATYETAVRLAPERASLWLKLSDLAFLRGELADEQRLREKIYGSLR